MLKQLHYFRSVVRPPFGSGISAAAPADEVANVAELLMSDRGGFITSSTFLMDGGTTASYFYGPLKPVTED